MEKKRMPCTRKYTASLPLCEIHSGGGDGLLGGGHHVIHGEAELLKEPVASGGCAVVVDAHAATCLAHVLGPTKGRASLNGDASLDVRKDHRVALLGILSGEPLQAGQRDNASANALGRESLLGLNGEGHLGARSEKLHVHGAGGRVR